MPPISILVALADPTRCRLIELLRAGPQPVHVLAAAFKISRPAISRHLRVLKESGLISENKFGRENRYALHPAKLAPVQRWLAGLLPPPKAKPDATAVIKTAPAAAAEPAVQPIINVETPVAVVVPAPEPVAIPAAPIPAKAAKTRKPVKTAAPAEPTKISQMGFDF
ncbi:MAG: ArsR/SmtB family transcription factor [Devosia sp.]